MSSISNSSRGCVSTRGQEAARNRTFPGRDRRRMGTGRYRTRRTKTDRTLRGVRVDGLAEVKQATSFLRVIAGRWMQLRQATRTQPNEDHVPQNVLLALRDSLASPADFQRLNGPANILPHLDPISYRRQFSHRTTLTSLEIPGTRRTAIRLACLSPCDHHSASLHLVA